MSGRLAEKVAVVTGAGGGIGRETCRLFASEGARIVAVDIKEDSGRETGAEIEADHPEQHQQDGQSGDTVQPGSRL